ncbi:Beta-adrenergic receptor kinase 2 [Larimichthys crocea]|uniref:Uncharacterized protein n=1 Tax=Larimichthys crocea TaxID=215358 RepID=A0ACD3QLZ1_LARCR|nr:Beta-adrenergic receptor kinase 2 [Larimichthys crocea]
MSAGPGGAGVHGSGRIRSNKARPNETSTAGVSRLFHKGPVWMKPYIVEICDSLRGKIFQKFIESDKFTRFCQWKNVELNIHLTMNDFSVHRIIGRGGFGEDCPFIVCMTYAFHTPDKLCFILDLMNGRPTSRLDQRSDYSARSGASEG